MLMVSREPIVKLYRVPQPIRTLALDVVTALVLEQRELEHTAQRPVEC